MGSLRFSYVGHMDHGVFETVAVEGFAAGALHQRTRFLRRKSLTGLPHRIFPRCPVALIAPSLKIGIGTVRQERPPRGFKIGAGLVERRSRSVGAIAWMATRIETAVPLPRIGVMRVADAPRDRASVDIAVVDVPAFLAGFSRSTAGELRHTALKRGLSRRALISGPGLRVSFDTMHAKRATPRVVDSQSRMRGGADDYNSSSLFWDDAGFDAKLSFARLSSLARGNSRRQFRG
jgi:hypothetical protein